MFSRRNGGRDIKNHFVNFSNLWSRPKDVRLRLFTDFYGGLDYACCCLHFRLTKIDDRYSLLMLKDGFVQDMRSLWVIKSQSSLIIKKAYTSIIQ